MNYGIIITCGFIIAAVAAVGISAIVITKKIKNFSRKYFGTSDISQAFKEQKATLSETPKSLHGMTNVYLPMIKKDFPEFDYELYRNKAQSLLRSYFSSIENKKLSDLSEECSQTLKNSVQNIIWDLNSRNVSQVFDEVVLHNTQISRYIKDGKTVTVLFEISVGYFSYTVDESGKVVFGDKETKTQTVYEVGLVYVQDIDKISGFGSGFGMNCPNCGAPIKNLGIKFCEYCGTGVSEVNHRVWNFDSVREATIFKKQY